LSVRLVLHSRIIRPATGPRQEFSCRGGGECKAQSYDPWSVTKGWLRECMGVL